METALKFDARERKLKLHVKELFGSKREGVSCLVAGSLCTVNGTVQGKVVLRNRIIPKGSGLRIDLYGRVATEEPPTAGLSACQSVDLSADGLLAFEAAGSVETNEKLWGRKGKDPLRKVAATGQVSIKQTIFNFNDEQDVQVSIGYDLIKKTAFTTLRENNWTLNWQNVGNRWNVHYAL